jgi:hypothetical protein
VATETGSVPIEEIEVGDQVWACNPETGMIMLAEVTRVFVRTSDHLLVVTVGGETIVTTAEHSFWVVGRGWTRAARLVVGDVLRTLEGGTVAVEGIQHQDGAVIVYNFEVAGDHTYFVSQRRVLVHNVCARLDSARAESDRSRHKMFDPGPPRLSIGALA